MSPMLATAGGGKRRRQQRQPSYHCHRDISEHLEWKSLYPSSLGLKENLNLVLSSSSFVDVSLVFLNDSCRKEKEKK